MGKRKTGPKVGKWWAHLKRSLLLLPQESVAAEVDFCPLPDIVEDECNYWLSLVASHNDGSLLMHSIDEQPPTLDDIAHLLAGAMTCPHTRVRFRPEAVLVRDYPGWQGMVPYLKELGIETVVTEELSQWDTKAEAMIRWMQDHWSTFPRPKTYPDKLPIPKALYDLRTMAHWFVAIQRVTPNKKEPPP